MTSCVRLAFSPETRLSCFCHEKEMKSKHKLHFLTKEIPLYQGAARDNKESHDVENSRRTLSIFQNGGHGAKVLRE
jgi:hypothetical protein